jgi:adenylylsulfate kinase-like enzyme
MKNILITGLPGSGKTTLALELVRLLKADGYPVVYLNGDAIRDAFADDDFTMNGRSGQAERMGTLASLIPVDIITVCDFVCPTKNTRAIFFCRAVRACFHHIETRRFPVRAYADTNEIYEPCDHADLYSWEATDPAVLYTQIRSGEKFIYTYEKPSFQFNYEI